jgi:MraZ protein
MGRRVTDTGLYIGGALQGVDRKGRVAIPVGFRTAIERNSAERIILVAYHPKLPCLRAFDSKWAADAEEDFRRRLHEGADSSAVDAEREAIFGEVDHAPFDPSGRFSLDQFARDEVHIKDRAFFQGAGPTFNIWAPEVLIEHPGVNDRVRRKCASLMAGKGGE